MSKFKIGQKYLELTILSKFMLNGVTMYEVQCDCGNIKNVRSSQIGKTKTCGCAKRRIDSKKFKKPGEVSHNINYKRYKETAKKRNLKFNLSKNEFKNIISQDCYYCGNKPKKWSCYNINKKPKLKETIERSYIYINGIDRLNNDLGYTIDNCVPCCSMCNSFKSNFTEKSFLNHVRKINEYQKR